MPNRMPEDMPGRMPEDMPGRMPEDMPNRMPEDMPNKMPEDMSDRMPEDLPVTKRINVMVGITRTKVILSFSPSISKKTASKSVFASKVPHNLGKGNANNMDWSGLVWSPSLSLSVCMHVCMFERVHMYSYMQLYI